MLYEGYEFKKQKAEIKQEILDEDRKLNQLYQDAPSIDDLNSNMEDPTSIPYAEEKKEHDQK